MTLLSITPLNHLPEKIPKDGMDQTSLTHPHSLCFVHKMFTCIWRWFIFNLYGKARPRELRCINMCLAWLRSISLRHAE